MNEINVSYNINSLTKEELSLLTEALLFSSSVDVCANWFKEHALKMAELGIRIRNTYPEVLTENLYIFDHTPPKQDYCDDHTKDIQKAFPEMAKEDITK